MESPLTKKQKYWLSHIEATQKNELPFSEYAKQHRIDLKALYNWNCLLKKKGIISSDTKQSAFVEVAAPTVVASDSLIILLPNNIRVELRRDFQVFPLLKELSLL